MQGIPSLILPAVPPLLTKAVYQLEDFWLCCPDCKQHRVLCGNTDGASGVLERIWTTCESMTQKLEGHTVFRQRGW
jgi:hypothetical protein